MERMHCLQYLWHFQYKILSEKTNEDGSIVIEIKKQYNSSPVGEYLNKEGI